MGATLITSLVVTVLSARSIDRFLRARIEQSFPAELNAASQRLDLWYEQRLLELGVFSTSKILVQNVELLQSSPNSKHAERARHEIEQYLSYVLESFPQYSALAVRGADGEQLLWVGETLQLPEEGVRVHAGSATEARFGGAINSDAGIIQMATVALGSDRVGALQAVLPMEAVAEVLRSDDRGEETELFLVDQTGRYLVASEKRIHAGGWTAPLFPIDQPAQVTNYLDYQGQRVVGCAKPMARFGWTIAIEEPYVTAFAPVVGTMRRNLGINLAIVLGFCLVAFRIANSIAHPIEALSAAAQRISDGERDVDLPETSKRDEVGVMTRTIKGMTRRLEQKAQEVEASQAQTEQAVDRLRQKNEELLRVNEVLEQLSITDGLTKLHNHRYFQEHLTRVAKRAAKSGKPLALALIDIDHFKLWNDRLGHSGGDTILQQIAEIMQDLTRADDLLARYGGEEFALLLPDTDLEAAIRLAEKIRTMIATRNPVIDVPSEASRLTVSIGVSVFAGDKRKFFDEADQALYRAKSMGRDCVMAADGEGQAVG